MSDDNKVDVALTVEQATLPAVREFVIDRPGHINYAEQRGNYVGCKIVSFTRSPISDVTDVKSAADKMNTFFREQANLLVVGIWPFADRIDVLFTNTLDGEQLEEMKENERVVALHMQEWKKERAERQTAQQVQQNKAQEEVKRLVAKGRKCENDHGGLGKKKVK